MSDDWKVHLIFFNDVVELISLVIFIESQLRCEENKKLSRYFSKGGHKTLMNISFTIFLLSILQVV